MKNVNRTLTMATAALLALGFNATAEESVVSTAKMQTYKFTYNFKKLQDPVIQLAHETQQYIAYELINETQTAAHAYINETGNNIVIVAYQANEQQNDQMVITE
ncbi:MAG: hypothetical protein ACI8WB_003157 [Phenylobacterium sp.]|jgi:hypothetical protein